MSLVTMTTLSESEVNSWTSNTTSHNQIELSIGSSVLAGYIHLQFIHTIPSIVYLHRTSGVVAVVRLVLFLVT